MKNAQDFTAAFQNILGSFPANSIALQEAFEKQSVLAEKLSAVSIGAAKKSSELSAKWTQDALSNVQSMTTAKAAPADYAKSAQEFASASTEAASANMTAFAEIAKAAREQTLELLTAAGKDMSKTMIAAAK